MTIPFSHQIIDLQKRKAIPFEDGLLSYFMLV